MVSFLEDLGPPPIAILGTLRAGFLLLRRLDRIDRKLSGVLDYYGWGARCDSLGHPCSVVQNRPVGALSAGYSLVVSSRGHHENVSHSQQEGAANQRNAKSLL